METPRELLTRIMREAAEREFTSPEEMLSTLQARNISRARAEFLVRAYVEGFTVSQLAKFLNKDRQSVREALKRAGIALRNDQRTVLYTGTPYICGGPNVD